MFTVFQLVTIVSILMAFVFLVLFIQLNAFSNSQRTILFILILMGVFLLLTELLISFHCYNLIIGFFPLYYVVLFAVYPLFYLYFRKFAFSETHIAFTNYYKHLLLTVIVAIALSVYYLPLNHNQKLNFILNEFSSQAFTDNSKPGIIISIYSLYYIQFIFYLLLLKQLLRYLRFQDDQDNRNISLPVSTWIKLFIVCTIIIELSILLANIYLPPEQNRQLEQIISLLYIIFIGFLGINQSKLLVQVRLYQANAQDHRKQSVSSYNQLISESEKHEIRSLIELVIKEKKLFVNPDLKLDELARTIHYPSWKMSQVIHEVYGKNFSNFINDYRIREAIGLIDTGKRISVEEICQRVGFNSRSTFNRAFKTVTHQTPREYLLQIKISDNK